MVSLIAIATEINALQRKAGNTMLVVVAGVPARSCSVPRETPGGMGSESRIPDYLGQSGCDRAVLPRDQA